MQIFQINSTNENNSLVVKYTTLEENVKYYQMKNIEIEYTLFVKSKKIYDWPHKILRFFKDKNKEAKIRIIGF